MLTEDSVMIVDPPSLIERRWSWISKHRFEIAEQNEGEIFHFFFSYQLCLAKLNSGIGRFKRPLALAWK